MKNLSVKYSSYIFEVVVEHAPNAIILIDGEGCIGYINEHTEKLFGYDRAELDGQHIEILMPVRFRKSHPGHRNSFIDTPIARPMGGGRDLYALRKDGTEIQVEIGLNPINTMEGPIVLVSVIDITERKNQEAIIKKQLIELAIKNKDLEEFTYIASHDLQEPLRTITNYIQILKMDLPDLDPIADEYLNAIDLSSRRMKALVRGLLDFSRIGTGRVLVSADCRKIVNDVLSDLAGLISSTGAVIYIGELPTLNVYEAELRQLFQNLISNAIKFKKPDLRPEISISCVKLDGHWLYSVRDNGIGIEPRYFDKIFHIFQRLHAQDSYEGYGIGLAYCKKIAELHAGKIWLESTPGEGCTFYFTISNLKL